MAKNGFKACDSDIHISEPNFWEQYIDQEFKDQAPRLVPDEQCIESGLDIPWPLGMAGGCLRGRRAELCAGQPSRGPHSEAAMAEVVRR